jgi:AcrR family transcriptional regulator
VRAKTDRRHAQGDESRERILDATIEIASLRGYQGTSIAEVSKRSGLPASSIYWHFEDKDDLIAAVIQRSFDAWLSTTIAVSIRRPGMTAREHLVTSMRNQAKALVASPEFLRLGLMLALEQHAKEPSARALFLQVRAQALAVVVDSFERTLAEAHGTGNTALARRIAILTMAAADGLFIAQQVEPSTVDLADEFELLAEMIMDVVERVIEPSTQRAGS